MAARGCRCVARHSPPYFEGNLHHVVPQSWGGPSVPENLIEICMNTHGNVHNGLNAVTRFAWETNTTGTLTSAELDAVTRPYPAYTRALIRRAVVGVGWKIPHVYTTHYPHPHD